MGERYQCPECDKIFGSRQTLVEHSDIEHGRPVEFKSSESLNLGELIKNLNFSLNRNFLAGFLLGVFLVSAAFSGYLYWDSMDHRQEVTITVVDCESCNYSKFRKATDRMFNANYREVDYRSEEGQKLIQKHNLKYIPGFVFDKKQLQKAENFSKIESTLVDSGDAYVIPDEGVKVAQRLSDGKSLDR